MTLDELTKIYRDEIALPKYPGWDEKHRAGVKAVVEALRDELPRALSEIARRECCGHGNVNRYGDQSECCDIPNLLVTTDQVHDALNEILASDGEVKAAGGAGSRQTESSRPAADLVAMVEAEASKPVSYKPGFPAAAPDVCEWTLESKRPGSGWLDCKGNRHWIKTVCPCCNRSIRFKPEAANEQ